MNWYEKYIEEPIRPCVKLLRDNGFNTECSCGHEMYVQCQYITDGEIMRLDQLLYDNGYRDYNIEMVIKRRDGYIFTTWIEIKLNGDDEEVRARKELEAMNHVLDRRVKELEKEISVMEREKNRNGNV